ncbi:MAG: PKD domain-containing protein, partial [Thermoplasmata archaeon]|nr:PKD domain-containing protein [Thermoplasmata archaeon]
MDRGLQAIVAVIVVLVIVFVSIGIVLLLNPEEDTKELEVGMVLSCRTPRAGEDVSFEVEEIENGKDKGKRYTWDFGDGDTGTGSSINHSFFSPGDYAVSLRVKDTNGDEGQTTEMIIVQSSSSSRVVPYFTSPYPSLNRPCTVVADSVEVTTRDLKGGNIARVNMTFSPDGRGWENISSRAASETIQRSTDIAGPGDRNVVGGSEWSLVWDLID